MRIVRTFLLSSCFAAAAALAAPAGEPIEKRAASLAGYWFMPGKDAAEARVLRITNVVFAEGGEAVLAGQYGPAGVPVWPEAREITARVDSGRLVVDLVPASEAPVKLVASHSALAAAGRGPRFERRSLDEIRRFVASRPAPEARARRDSTVELVYIGANDCGLCRRWEATHLGKGRLAGSPDWPHIRFTEVKLATLTAEFRREDVPERLRPRFDALLAAGLQVQGVPSFVLFVDDAFRAHGLGLDAFDSFVLLALRSAVREKIGKT